MMMQSMFIIIIVINSTWENKDKYLTVILAMYRFLLKKNFNGEADAIFKAINEEASIYL